VPEQDATRRVEVPKPTCGDTPRAVGLDYAGLSELFLRAEDARYRIDVDFNDDLNVVTDIDRHARIQAPGRLIFNGSTAGATALSAIYIE
jgi:hypothetical protein